MVNPEAHASPAPYPVPPRRTTHKGNTNVLDCHLRSLLPSEPGVQLPSVFSPVLPPPCGHRRASGVRSPASHHPQRPQCRRSRDWEGGRAGQEAGWDRLAGRPPEEGGREEIGINHPGLYLFLSQHGHKISFLVCFLEQSDHKSPTTAPL